ncbi:MAG TPA: LacI family DNA-binding transcriptional regulator [Chloroflexota bacterium]
MSDDDQTGTPHDSPDGATPAGTRGTAAAGIRDVAQQAGVSPATVSRVLNGSAVVTPEVRRRVLEAIGHLGYRPNQVARNLRRQQAEMIGVVIGDVENPFFTETVRTVEDAAYNLGYRMLLCNTDENAEKQRAYLRVMAAERVLGVILAPSEPNAAEISDLLDLGIPVVAFDRAAGDPRADSVTADNWEAGRTATEHLLEWGCRHIVLVSSAEIATGAERLAGYEEAMHSAGLQPRLAPGFSRAEGGMTAVEELLRQEERPDALIAGNGLMTMGALKALRRHEVRIPEDIAFVSIDDPFWAELADPPLTALAQPVRQMAQTVIELLVGRLQNRRDEPRHLVYPFDLRIRASSGRL